MRLQKNNSEFKQDVTVSNVLWERIILKVERISNQKRSFSGIWSTWDYKQTKNDSDFKQDVSVSNVIWERIILNVERIPNQKNSFFRNLIYVRLHKNDSDFKQNATVSNVIWKHHSGIRFALDVTACLNGREWVNAETLGWWRSSNLQYPRHLLPGLSFPPSRPYIPGDTTRR